MQGSDKLITNEVDLTIITSTKSLIEKYGWKEILSVK